MTFINEATMRTRFIILGLAAAASLAACTELKVQNKAPNATIALTEPTGFTTRLPTGFPNPVTQLPLFAGSPVSVTLSAAASKDPDGTITRYIWKRTDVPRAVRYPGTGPMAPAAGTTGGAAGATAGAGGGAAGAAAGAGGGAAGAAAGAAGATGAAGAAPPPPPLAPGGLGVVSDPGDKDASITVELPAAGSYRFSVWAVDDKGYISAPASLTVDLRPAPMM